MRRWVLLRKRERPAGPGVVRVPRKHVRVEVRERVPEQVVVHLHRPEVLLERASDPQDLEPVARGLVRLELGRLGDVTAAPYRHGVAALVAGLLQVGIRNLTGEDPDPPLRLVRAALAAHLAALAAAE